MITQKELKKERTPNKVVMEVEAKRIADINSSNKQGAKLERRLVGKSIFPSNKKRRW